MLVYDSLEFDRKGSGAHFSQVESSCQSWEKERCRGLGKPPKQQQRFNSLPAVWISAGKKGIPFFLCMRAGSCHWRYVQQY